MSSTVLVTGATGYIAHELTKQLIEKNYKVVGTVRSQIKGDALKARYQKNFEYVIVPDMGKPGAFDEALRQYPEVSAFFHTASPFHFNDENVEESLLRPALDGTKFALSSAKSYGKKLKKFIVTSSFAAIGYSYLSDSSIPRDIRIDEKTWTEIPWNKAVANGFVGYHASKTIAEREVWRFQKEEKPHFDFVSINPTFVLGPHAFDSELEGNLNQSTDLLNTVLHLKSESDVFELRGNWVDVRDTAKAHLVALEKDEANNQRIILSAGPFSEQLFLNILNKHYPKLKGPKGDPSNTERSLVDVGHGVIDDSHSRSLLGFEYTSFDRSISDAFAQLLKRESS